MTLTPGTRLGPYEVTALIGAGGMGEVYAATDTRLGRAVAIKILPPEVSADPDRRARFEREARTVGALSHPNVVAIFDVGTTDDVTFLVMELLEGETLRARLNHMRPAPTPGPATPPPDASATSAGSGAKRLRGLPMQKALDIAAHVAQGLAAAHARGIVHRDLKPENIFLTTDGRVKVLDFGLARAVTSAGANAETRTTPVHEGAGPTQPGVVLGTAGYMAPEQVRGREADHRADVFALGAVLYEMLTGARAFAADSAIETMSAVLSTDPLERRDLTAALPPAVEGMVRHCLEKQPDERFQSARDLAFQLQALGSGSSMSGAATALEEPTRLRRTWVPVAGAFAAGVVLTSALAAWLQPWMPDRNEAPVSYSELLTPGAVLSSFVANGVAISPDGSRVAFTARDSSNTVRLFQRRRDSREATPIAGVVPTGGSSSPSFSPDGRSIAFFSGTAVQTVPVDGGTPVELTRAQNGFGLAWGADDHIIYNPGPSMGLWRVRSSGGVAEELTKPDRARLEWAHFTPSSFLPDGIHMLFSIWYGAGRYNVALLNTQTRTWDVILEDSSYAQFAGSGHLVYSRADGLYARRFDPKSRTLSGPEVPVVRDAYLGELSNLGQFAMSGSGDLVYVTGQPRLRELVMVALDGAVTPLPRSPRRYIWPRFSPKDRDRIAVTIQEGQFNNIWIADQARDSLTRVPLDAYVQFPIWTPDGERLVFLSDVSGAGHWGLYEQAVETSRSPKQLFEPPPTGGWFQTGSWMSPGRVLGVGRAAHTTEVGAAILALKLDSNKANLEELLPAEPGVETYNVRLSPDGSVVAYVSRRSGRAEVYVASLSNLSQAKQVSQNGGARALWAPSGNTLFFVGSGRMLAANVRSQPALQASVPQLLFDITSFAMGDNYTSHNFDISPDGKQFVMVRVKTPDTGAPINTSASYLNVITNFTAVLRERVPVR